MREPLCDLGLRALRRDEQIAIDVERLVHRDDVRAAPRRRRSSPRPCRSDRSGSTPTTSGIITIDDERRPSASAAGSDGAAWCHGLGVGRIERLRADAQHAVGRRDLRVDEHRHEAAEEHAAAVEPAARPATASAAPRSSVSFDTGFSSARTARKKMSSYGMSASCAIGKSSIDVRQLQRLGRRLHLHRRARLPASRRSVDLVPEVVDGRAQERRDRDRLVRVPRVDPDLDRRRSRRTRTVERLERLEVEQLADRRRDVEVVAALDELHLLELGQIVARRRARRHEHAAAARAARYSHRSRPSALPIVSSKMPSSVSMRTPASTRCRSAARSTARCRARGGRRSRRGPTARRRRTGRRRRRGSCRSRGTAASRTRRVACRRARRSSACRRACRGCRAAPRRQHEARARAA